MKRCLTAVALLFAISLLPSPAKAHKVMVFAWVEGQTVHTESKFSGGKRVKGGKIEVFDHANRRVAEGVTDDAGGFDFPAPEGARRLNIVLTAGMGHTNHWTVTAEELGVTAPEPDKKIPGAAVKAPTGGAVALDAEAIETIVERTLDKKLAPLRAQMADQSWGLRDIVAGIGYILGLMGLASYMHHRRK